MLRISGHWRPPHDFVSGQLPARSSADEDLLSREQLRPVHLIHPGGGQCLGHELGRSDRNQHEKLERRARFVSCVSRQRREFVRPDRHLFSRRHWTTEPSAAAETAT